MKQDEHLRRVGKWEKRLCPGCDCLSSDEKVAKTSMETNTPKTIDDSNSTSCCFCHKYVRKDVRRVGIANAKLGQGLLGVVSTLLQFCGILTIRETKRV